MNFTLYPPGRTGGGSHTGFPAAQSPLLSRAGSHYVARMTAPSQISDYNVTARSTDVFGRVLCGVRDHHFIIDGPVQNGAPGEEVTPVEVFLSAVAACGVELIQAIARKREIPLRAATVSIHGVLDRTNQVRTDLRTLNSVAIDFSFAGVDDAQGTELVEGFKRL